MSKPNQQYAYFTVFGDFDPAHITATVQREPSKSWQKGDIHPNGHERKFSRWSFESRLERTALLEEHISDVLVQMNERSKEFIEVSRKYSGHMQLVGYFYERYPGLHFERELVERIAQFGLSIDFDFYHYWMETPEETND
jgi:Domain of unknown function (DUF4279)